ncbi:hypothetical protein ACSBR2_008779 [Camellia fascicularis]
MESMPTVFLTAHHTFCIQHLQRNLKDKMKYVNKLYRVGMVSKLRACAYASIVTDFNEKIDAFIQGKRYGEMCSNAAESFNNWIKEACNLPITRLVDAIRTQIMNQMSEHRGVSST